MRQRLISAAVLVPVVVAVFLAGQPWLTFGIAALAALAGYETAQLTRSAGLPANRWIAVAVPPVAVLGVAVAAVPGGNWAFQSDDWVFVAPAVALWFIGCALVAIRTAEAADGFRAWVGTAFASLYPSLLAFTAATGVLSWNVTVTNDVISVFDRGRLWLLVLVLTVWSLDSAAYVVGRYFPRGLFMHHISPKKTWSGALGGTVAAVAVCTLLLAVTNAAPPHAGVVIGIAVAVAAQAGDLAESMLKRAAGAKDSGTLIPGHGGILDRVDSFLFAGPVIYAAMLLLLFNADIAR